MDNYVVTSIICVSAVSVSIVMAVKKTSYLHPPLA